MRWLFWKGRQRPVHPQCQPNDRLPVLYVGDHLEKDIIGATAMGWDFDLCGNERTISTCSPAIGLEVRLLFSAADVPAIKPRPPRDDALRDSIPPPNHPPQQSQPTDRQQGQGGPLWD
jgi:hypothetical protein